MSADMTPDKTPDMTTDMTAPGTRRLRVVMAGPDPAGNGGIESVTALMATHCSRFADIEVVPTYRFGSPVKRVATALTGTARVLRRLSRRDVDLVHLHMAKRASIARKGVLTLLARAYRVPVVLHCHGGMFERDYRRMPRLLQRLVSGVLRQAQSVVVLSDSWRSVYHDLVHVPADRLTVLPNGIELPAGVPERSLDPLVVAFLGRLGQRKGAWDVITAVAELPEPVQARIRVVMAGDGAVAYTQDLAIRLGLTDVVEVRNWLAPAVRDRLLARSAVFVLPSRNEGLPMAMLEAMGWGLVPVVSAVGGIPEVVTDGVNGFLVRPGDPAQLAATLCRLVEDPELVTRLSAAARRSVEGYDMNDYADQMAEIWRSVLDGSRRHRSITTP
jgi:glycosyltransferase involved in cell wall biosynthesis